VTVRFAYIDETGHSGNRLDDPRQPILTLVAVVINENQVQPLAKSLRDLVFAVLGWRPSGIEVHGQQIWAGTGPWKGIAPERRLASYVDALGLLEKHEALVAHASIDKALLRLRYSEPENPYLLALQFLCEKLNGWASYWGPVLLVADESKENELRAIEMVADLQLWGSGVVPGSPLGMIIDTLHFVRSQASPGVQMADLVAFTIHRHRHGVGSHPLAREGLDRLKNLVIDSTVTWRETWPN
jgi:hypothetical protein